MPAIVVALLLAVHVGAHSVTFTFRNAPATVRASYASKPLVQCASGLPVAVRGVHFVIRFQPARSPLAKTRIPGTGVVREMAKTCDFESDLGWAIGLDRRRPYNVARQGKRVTVTFR